MEGPMANDKDQWQQGAPASEGGAWGEEGGDMPPTETGAGQASRGTGGGGP